MKWKNHPAALTLSLIAVLNVFTACSSQTNLVVGPSASPASSPTPTATPTLTPVPSPTAQPNTPDGAVGYQVLEGYRLIQGVVETNSSDIKADNEINLATVLSSQADFDKYLMPLAGSSPAPIDFSQHQVLLTAKVTGAYSYRAQITALKMETGDLHADYSYSIVYSPDPMLNDYIRPVISLTRFDRVNYSQLRLKTQAITMGEPPPAPNKP